MNESLNKKIKYSKSVIKETLKEYIKPIVFISFGKDSMVLLHLIKTLEENVPCIYQKMPHFPKKQKFNNKIIQDWNLTVYTYPVNLVAAVESSDFNGNNTINFVSSFAMETANFLTEAQTFEPNFYEPYLCGFFDFLAKPKGHLDFKWDAAFTTYKNDDKNSLYELTEFPNTQISKVNGQVDIITPLKNWTNQDIWEYSQIFNVPQNFNLNTSNYCKDSFNYHLKNKYDNVTLNPKLYPTCTRCLDKRNPKSVYCHKYNNEIPNISAQIPYFSLPLKMHYFGCKEKFNKGKGLVISTESYKQSVENTIQENLKLLENNKTESRLLVRLGLAYQKQLNLDAAIKYFRLALKIKPDYHDAKFDLGLVYLLKGDFKKGWAYYESRFQQTALKRCIIPALPQEIWDGSSLKGKTIFVHSEQGLGDTIQFSRYLKILQTMADKVIFESQEGLEALIKENFAQIDICSSNLQNKPSFDTHISLMSLPFILKTNAENVPFKAGYIKANKNKIKYYKEKYFDNNDFKIGFVWRSKNIFLNDIFRSMPNADLFYKLAETKGVKLYSLQKDIEPKEFSSLSQNAEIINLGNDFNDFSDTAAAIENLDLVISVDTSVAHLAGALGKPTWIIIPYAADWKWLLNTEKSYWYNSVKLFRQTEPCNWRDVMQNVYKQIELILVLEVIKKHCKKSISNRSN